MLISKKPTGTLVAGDLNPGKHLYLLSTGTGIAPFLSITKDPEIYEQFEKIILVHGVRYKKRFGVLRPLYQRIARTRNTSATWLKEKLIY